MSIHLKKGSAFLEVVISMAMLGVVLTSLFVTTGSCMNWILKTSSKLSVVLPLKHSFYLVTFDPSEEEKRTLPLPAYCTVGSIQFTQKKVAGHSVFSRFTNLYLQSAQTDIVSPAGSRAVSFGLLACIAPKRTTEEVS